MSRGLHLCDTASGEAGRRAPGRPGPLWFAVGGESAGRNPGVDARMPLRIRPGTALEAVPHGCKVPSIRELLAPAVEPSGSGAGRNQRPFAAEGEVNGEPPTLAAPKSPESERRFARVGM